MNIEQFISIDTNQTIMEEADTLMEEYEQQKLDQLRARVKELEASNKELLEALVYLLDQCEENERNKANFMGASTFAREQANKAIQKARGQG